MRLRGAVIAGVVWTAALLAGVADARAQQGGGRLETVLRQMDTAKANFHSAEADFRWELFERVVRETTTQNGTIYFLRNGGATEMGAKIAPPQAKTLEYKDGKLRLFDPGSNHLTTLSAGTNQAQYEGFLTLGFGGGGRELEKVWTITDQGTEQMSDGSKTVPVEKLDLVSKDPGSRNTFTHVTIWVDPARGVSLKQQFFLTSGDTRTAFYTHIRYNDLPKAEIAKFAIKTDKKTTFDNR